VLLVMEFMFTTSLSLRHYVLVKGGRGLKNVLRKKTQAMFSTDAAIAKEVDVCRLAPACTDFAQQEAG
jgi:hypothetical protein